MHRISILFIFLLGVACSSNGASPPRWTPVKNMPTENELKALEVAKVSQEPLIYSQKGEVDFEFEVTTKALGYLVKILPLYRTNSGEHFAPLDSRECVYIDRNYIAILVINCYEFYNPPF